MGPNTRSYEYSVQISAFQSFQIQNGDLKTIFHCSSSTIHRAAETAVGNIYDLRSFDTISIKYSKTNYGAHSYYLSMIAKTLPKGLP